jgi:hypothetical protein
MTRNIMTPFPYAQGTGTKAKPVTIGWVGKGAAVAVDFSVVCLWALIGLIATFVLVACVGSVDFADFLVAAG